MSCRVVDTAYLWFFGICVEIFLVPLGFLHSYLGDGCLVGYWVLGIGYSDGVV